MKKLVLVTTVFTVVCVGAGIMFGKKRLQSGSVEFSATVAEVSAGAVCFPGHQDDGINHLINRIEAEILNTDFGPQSTGKEVVFRAIVFELARLNRTAVIKKLIDAEQDITFLDFEGNSLLHVAAEQGHPELTKLLSDQGFALNRPNLSERTPLFLAATHNNLDCIKQLLNDGADPNGGSTHQAPLNAAAWYGYPLVIQILLNASADIECTDADGNTPLHKAVWQGNFDIVEQLLNAGAGAKMANEVGITPRQLANMRIEQNRNKNPKRAWGEEHILGKPDAGDAYSQWEWCPSTIGQQEWLELTFEKEVVPSQFEVYAKPVPSSVAKITVFDKDGNEHELWKGTATRAKNKSPHIAQIKVDTEVKTKRVKVYVDGTRTNSWMYFDAFGMEDVDGNRQWVRRAKSSTTYATGPKPIDKHQLVAELLGIEEGGE